MGAPFYLCDCLRVHVHRDLEIGVTKRFLNRLDILAVGLHQGPEAMPQGVPAYWIGDLQVCESWLDVDAINAAWPVGFPHACEFDYFQPPPRAA